MNPIREDYVVFVHDGDKQIGAVRHVSHNEIRIYVENAGDFTVPLSAVKEVEQEHGMQVAAIVRLSELRDWVATQADLKASLAAIDAYQQQYGA